MKRLFAVLSLLIVLLIPVSAAQDTTPALTEDQVIAQTVASTVRVTGTMYVQSLFGQGWEPYVCSAFYVAPNAVLTAAHCLGDSMKVSDKAAKFVKIDQANDLMLLAVETEGVVLPPDFTPLNRGQQVIAVGYALGYDSPFVTKHTVELVEHSWHQDGSQKGTFVVPSFIGGMSGGPIVNLDGRVVGIVQDGIDAAGFGVGSKTIADFLNSSSD